MVRTGRVEKERRGTDSREARLKARARRASAACPPLSSPPPPSPLLYVVGSLNADLVLSLARLPAPGETLAASSLSTFPGGKGGNQAVAAAKLGWPTRMVGLVGGSSRGEEAPPSSPSPPPSPDGGGALLLASLAGAGVDTRYVACLAGVPTGTAVIMVQEGTGENSIVIVAGANGEEGAWLAGQALAGAMADLARGPASVGALLLQREVPDAVNTAAAAAARSGGVPVLLDVGGDDAPLPASLLACVDVVSPNESELARLTGLEAGTAAEAARAACALLDAAPGVRAVLVKRGAAGSLLVERGRRGGPPTITSQAAAPVVAVVDTTGAGDCFTAAYAVASLRGLEPTARLRYASAAAGLCVQARGAGPSMPGGAAVDAALEAWERVK